MRIRTRIGSLSNKGRLTMAITQKDRDDFLRRIGAVRRARLAGSEEPEVYLTEGGQEWDDEGIEFAIFFGF